MKTNSNTNQRRLRRKTSVIGLGLQTSGVTQAALPPEPVKQVQLANQYISGLSHLIEEQSDNSLSLHNEQTGKCFGSPSISSRTNSEVSQARHISKISEAQVSTGAADDAKRKLHQTTRLAQTRRESHDEANVLSTSPQFRSRNVQSSAPIALAEANFLEAGGGSRTRNGSNPAREDTAYPGTTFDARLTPTLPDTFGRFDRKASHMSPISEIGKRQQRSGCGSISLDTLIHNRRSTARPPSCFDQDMQSSVPMLQLNGEDLKQDSRREKAQHLWPRRSEHFTTMFGVHSRHESFRLAHPEYSRNLDLKNSRQIDIFTDIDDPDMHKGCNHAPVARNWSVVRKRWSAMVTCINTSCTGLIIGIYAGEVPAIQYVVIDLNHTIVLGNVVLYLGLMLSTLLLWPLPLLHGRKPYTIIGLMLTLSLQVPQGLAVIAVRYPDETGPRVLLLLSRALSGIVLGLCDINLAATLLDLFGASLQSSNPHQEVADSLDIRRHGGGMGVWLGVWSWCTIGPLSIGFMIGTIIVKDSTVDWGFWLSQLIIVIVLLVNLMAPEVRRSAFRRSVADLLGPEGRFSRVARGEIKMHLESKGPAWWGEEVMAGFRLVKLMLKQFGFLVLAFYTAWVYAQFVLISILIGSLASTAYGLLPVPVGLCVLSLALGALLATPFQKASWFSRARFQRPRTDSMTFTRSIVWTSHMTRRIIFTAALPFAAIAFTLTSTGPPLSIAVPCIMATLIGFISNLAIAECCGILFETFDTSDLQPGMTGRPARHSIVQRYYDQRTNFSCYPRIMAGISIIQALKYGLAAAATGLTGRVTRSIGATQATSVVAGILFSLTVLLTIVMVRWNTVEMIPAARERRDGSMWEPVILGSPSGTMRKISILEAGRMTRWSEIRRRNRLEASLTGGLWNL